MGAWGKDAQSGIPHFFWAKNYNPGGTLYLVALLIAMMEFRTIRGGLKRAFYLE